MTDLNRTTCEPRPLERSEVTPIPKAPKVSKTARKAKKAQPMRDADRLFSLIVRSRGKCEIGVVAKCPSGALQCAHIISRRYRALRWDESNAVAACAGDHLWMTLHPLEWEAWVDEHIGADLHKHMKHRALSEPNPKLASVLTRLEQRWAVITRNRPDLEAS